MDLVTAPILDILGHQALLSINLSVPRDRQNREHYQKSLTQFYGRDLCWLLHYTCFQKAGRLCSLEQPTAQLQHHGQQMDQLGIDLVFTQDGLDINRDFSLFNSFLRSLQRLRRQGVLSNDAKLHTPHARLHTMERQVLCFGGIKNGQC